MSDTPLVSAIVTVFNRKATVTAAVDSLRRQTVNDIEIVVVDDGSTDGSPEAVAALADPRVRVVRHDCNRGIPAARNTGLSAARGRFIAWLDSDDLARPNRFERQLRFLEAHPDIVMCGSWAGRIGTKGMKRGARVSVTEPEEVKPALLFRSCFQQSSVFGHAEILRRKPYRLEFPVCEDIDLFVRLSRTHRIANMAEILVDRRQHDGQTVQRMADLIRDRKAAIYQPLLEQLDLEPSGEDVERHVRIGNPGRGDVNEALIAWAEAWLTRIKRHNDWKQIYDRGGLDLAVAVVWLRLALASRKTHGFAAFGRALSSPLLRPLLDRRGRGLARSAIPAMLGWNRVQSDGNQTHVPRLVSR